MTARRLLLLLLVFGLMAPSAVGHSSAPLPAGHYAGQATATWSVTSSPRWLGAAALKAIALKEGLGSLPSKGTCTGVVGLDISADGGPVEGAARCEFDGDLARYNDRVAKLVAEQIGEAIEGTATCCGMPQRIGWSARRIRWQDAVTGAAAGSTAVKPVSIETRLGDVEVSMRVDWTVRFVASRVE